MMTRSPRVAVLCLMLLLATTAACGRKTLPLVPDSPKPEMVKGIKAMNRDVIAFLSWPIPARNIEGKDMAPADIQGFRIYRAEVKADQKKAKYRQIAEIDLANPAPARVQNGIVSWSDEQLQYGQIYSYQIRAVSLRGGISPPSEEIRIVPLRSLAIPKGVSAQGGDGTVLVTWDPVVTRVDGSQYDGFVGYNLYRGTGKGSYDGGALNPEPLRTPEYKDTKVANGRTYYYRVRAVDSPALPWKESLDSEEVSATTRDMTPPARPSGLTVVPGVRRVFLTWSESKERDIAGYHVYRSSVPGREFTRLTTKLLVRTTFSDETVASGATYYYKITAVDQAGNESAGTAEKKVTTETLREKKPAARN